MDSLAALSAHITQREAFEADVRRGWSRMAGACALLVAVEALMGGAVPGMSTSWLALFASTLGTGALAAVLFSAAAAAPWRAAADSVDRLALRHEDSPLRDRIRITQWMLFDSALSRFSANERRVNAVVAHGVMLVSVMGAVALALQPVFRQLLGGALGETATAMALFLFLVLTLVTIVATMRSGKQSFHQAQHYAKQVLALDADFGGFLPRAEKEHVTKIAEIKSGREPVPEDT